MDTQIESKCDYQNSGWQNHRDDGDVKCDERFPLRIAVGESACVLALHTWSGRMARSASGIDRRHRSKF